MRTLRYVVCDVFTDQALTGNQLAVFTDARGLGLDLMQALAREMCFSESVFVFPAESGGHAKLRIFTPRREIPFAGHPTLGSAFVIGSGVALPELKLETGAGIVPVRLEREGPRVSFGWMVQPLPSIERFEQVTELCAALGVERSELPVEVYDNGVQHTYVALASRDAVSRLKPDLVQLERLTVLGVSAFAGSGTDFKTRMFAPAAGVAEDPATGSAAGPLALHLVRHGRLEYGQTVRIEQGRELDRPSVLYARVLGSAEKLESIEVGGCAVIVARGEFRLPT